MTKKVDLFAFILEITETAYRLAINWNKNVYIWKYAEQAK